MMVQQNGSSLRVTGYLSRICISETEDELVDISDPSCVKYISLENSNLKVNEG